MRTRIFQRILARKPPALSGPNCRTVLRLALNQSDFGCNTEGRRHLEAERLDLIGAKQEIVAFVASRRQGKPDGEFGSYLKGSFNLSLVFRFNDGGPKAVIRFPKPGHTATDLREEKVKNEFHALRIIRERTTVPVPSVTSWGMTKDSPQHLGPFIIMDYIDGTSLATLLKEPTKTEKDELFRLNFTTIEAMSETESNEWVASDPPLTYNANELATVVSDYPTGRRPHAPFTSANAYFHSLADENLVHLRTQRSIADDRADAEKKFIAHICDDLQPTNMPADPATLRITAVLDFEFTNAMPVQFAYDPPWWLLLLGSDMRLEHHSMEEFIVRYALSLEQFLQALERVEVRSNQEEHHKNGTLLSARMRDSWATGRFWFDYGIRKSFDVDAVYWAALHKDGDEVLDDNMKEEMEKFVDSKMDQLRAYDTECRARFNE